MATLALLYAVLLAGLALHPAVLPAIAVYLAVNVAYSVRLKHVPVVDLLAVASGFGLRVWAGALAISVPLSGWIVVTTLALALYLAALKRREELARSGPAGRRVLGGYTVRRLDLYARTSAWAAALCYTLYVAHVRPELALSVPLVLFGLLRYWRIVASRRGGESPTDALYADPPLIATVVLWAALSAFALWPGG
jgi:4-hydroxybenzoate polyprenyltransferase